MSHHACESSPRENPSRLVRDKSDSRNVPSQNYGFDGNQSEAFEDSELDIDDFPNPSFDDVDSSFESISTSRTIAVDARDPIVKDLVDEDDELDLELCNLVTEEDCKSEPLPPLQPASFLPTPSYDSSISFRSAAEVGRRYDEDAFDSLSDSELYDAVTLLPGQFEEMTDDKTYDTDESLLEKVIPPNTPVTEPSSGEIISHDRDTDTFRSANGENTSLIRQPNALYKSKEMIFEGTQETCSPEESTQTADTPSITYPPITRSSFPAPVLDRSPVDSLTPTPTLKTCFRTGHALRTGVAANRRNLASKTLLEIYARVALSYREVDNCGNLNGRQIFELADLFHDRPPVLFGVYEGWLGIPLLEEDTSAFLKAHIDGEMRMCRCIARMEREDKRWKLTIMSIWEAEWEDILHVYGIVCA